MMNFIAIFYCCFVMMMMMTVVCSSSDNQENATVLRIAILTDPFKTEDGPASLTLETLTGYFKRSIENNNLTTIRRLDDGKIITADKRSSSVVVNIVPLYLQPGDNKKMKEVIVRSAKEERVVALVELSTCSSDTCNQLHLLANDLPDLTVFSMCCYHRQQSNFIYVGLHPNDVTGVILALKQTYRWRRFHFVMSPNWPTYDDFYSKVEEILAKNDPTIVMTQSFYCTRYLASGHICNNGEQQAERIVEKEATALIMLLDKNEDLPDFMLQLQLLQRKQGLLSKGKAYFLINHSGMTVVRSGVKLFKKAPDGLMILRRNFVNFNLGDKDDDSSLTQMLKSYDLHRYFWQYLRPITKTAELVGYNNNNESIGSLFCDTVFKFEDSDERIAYPLPCETSVAQVQLLNIIKHDSDDGSFTAVPCAVYHDDRRLNFTATPLWPGTNAVPPEEDFCRLDGSDCPPEPPNLAAVIAPTIIGFFVLLLSVVAIIGALIAAERSRKRNAEMLISEIVASCTEIEFQDEFDDDAKSHSTSRGTNSSASDTMSNYTEKDQDDTGFAMFAITPKPSSAGDDENQPEPPRVSPSHCSLFNKPIKARFRGDLATVIRLQKATPCQAIEAGDVLQELVQIRNLHHVNVNPFLAVTNDTYRIYYIQAFCSRGTLATVLAKRRVQLDRLFKLSFASDIAAGMVYIHKSPIGSHGRLSSQSVFIDSHWYCRIGNFPLPKFESESATSLAPNLYTAPELMVTNEKTAVCGTKKGDVYAYGILLQEIITRTQPYSMYDLLQDVMLKKISRHTAPPFRPKLLMNGDVEEMQDLCDLAKFCWEERPEFRPNFETVGQILNGSRHGGGDKKANLIDQMLKMLQEHAERLEETVVARSLALEDERRKTEEILYKMLPTYVVDELRNGRSVQPQLYESATVYFSDIVGFTAFASKLNPLEIVNFLNDLYSKFDAVIESYDVYKVETIGDSYMVCSGLPQPNGNRHASEIAKMALDIMMSCCDDKIQLRCGIHSGPVVAGVVGQKMPRYCLSGNTVAIAARMESSSLPMRIQLTIQSKTILDQIGGFEIIAEHQTFFLVGKTTLR